MVDILYVYVLSFDWWLVDNVTEKMIFSALGLGLSDYVTF